MKHGNKSKKSKVTKYQASPSSGSNVGGKEIDKMGMGGYYEKKNMGGFGVQVTASGKGIGSGMTPNFSGSCGSKRR